MPDTLAIADDVTCAQCGYRLRGLAPESNCPECGHAIADSIKTAPLMRWLPGFRRRGSFCFCNWFISCFFYCFCFSGNRFLCSGCGFFSYCLFVIINSSLYSCFYCWPSEDEKKFCTSLLFIKFVIFTSCKTVKISSKYCHIILMPHTKNNCKTNNYISVANPPI